MGWSGNALKTVKCLTKYLIISYNNHSNANLNEADFLKIYFKANNEFVLWSWEYVLFLIATGSPCFILGRKRDLRILTSHRSQPLTWPRNLFSVPSGGSVAGLGEDRRHLPSQWKMRLLSHQRVSFCLAFTGSEMNDPMGFKEGCSYLLHGNSNMDIRDIPQTSFQYRRSLYKMAKYWMKDDSSHILQAGWALKLRVDLIAPPCSLGPSFLAL